MGRGSGRPGQGRAGQPQHGGPAVALAFALHIKASALAPRLRVVALVLHCSGHAVLIFISASCHKYSKEPVGFLPSLLLEPITTCRPMHSSNSLLQPELYRSRLHASVRDQDYHHMRTACAQDTRTPLGYRPDRVRSGLIHEHHRTTARQSMHDPVTTIPSCTRGQHRATSPYLTHLSATVAPQARLQKPPLAPPRASVRSTLTPNTPAHRRTSCHLLPWLRSTHHQLHTAQASHLPQPPTRPFAPALQHYSCALLPATWPWMRRTRGPAQAATAARWRLRPARRSWWYA